MNKSMEKMFEILALYTMERTSLSISEIQEELGLPKSTVFRILNTLEKGNFIEKNEDNHRYSLSFQFFRLGSIYQSQLDFRTVALPIMKKLAEDSSETVELNIIDQLSRVCIEKIDSPLAVRNFVRVGERKPLHLGASGKILIAFLHDEEREQTVRLLEEKHETELSKLRKDLVEIRQNGYAFTTGERVPGSFAIAAPIYESNGESTASITLAGPIQRLSPEREQHLIQLLMRSSKEISERLGYFQAGGKKEGSL
ncbi:IclR family transcriptional regulator [Sporosarcina sp. FSL W7-1349]|uniref:IclR family transcriptional regulator n=1 Tax=Sporosarcina sp. FSL W7-1349 TaxID=2921561 RepID=UPI0030F7C387